MTKESAIEFQKIDCNCNDCIHLLRNNYRKQLQDQLHSKWQKEDFDRDRESELFIALTLRDKTVLSTTLKKKFMPKKPNMSYGYCKKFDLKEVSFIPNTCQLETQGCFTHRKNQ